MYTKEYLTRTFVIEGRIDKLCEKIEMLRTKQSSVGSFGLGVQQSRNYRQQEDISISILELESDMAEEKMTLLALETEIRAASRILDNPVSRAIITWRYICRLKWKDIARRAEMSEMQIIREHNAAILNMDHEIFTRQSDFRKIM